MPAFRIIRTSRATASTPDHRDALIVEQQATIARLQYKAEISQPARIASLEVVMKKLVAQGASDRHVLFEQLKAVQGQLMKECEKKNEIKYLEQSRERNASLMTKQLLQASNDISALKKTIADKDTRIESILSELAVAKDDLRKAIRREKAAKQKVKQPELWTLSNEEIERAIGNGRVVGRW